MMTVFSDLGTALVSVGKVLLLLPGGIVLIAVAICLLFMAIFVIGIIVSAVRMFWEDHRSR